MITSLISVLHVAGEAAARTFFNVYMDEGLNISLSLISVQLAARDSCSRFRLRCRFRFFLRVLAFAARWFW